MELLNPLCKPVHLVDVIIKAINISHITLRERKWYVIVLQSIAVRGHLSLTIFSVTRQFTYSIDSAEFHLEII